MTTEFGNISTEVSQELSVFQRIRASTEKATVPILVFALVNQKEVIEVDRFSHMSKQLM